MDSSSVAAAAAVTCLLGGGSQLQQCHEQGIDRNGIVLVMCGNVLLGVSIISGVFDHQARLVGNLEPLHASNQFGPTGRGGHEEQTNNEHSSREQREYYLETHDFPENIGPRISCKGRRIYTIHWLIQMQLHCLWGRLVHRYLYLWLVSFLLRIA